MLQLIGAVTYKLQLLVGVCLHGIFHVWLLKPYRGEQSTGPGLLPATKHGRAYPQPAEVIKSQLARGI